MSLVCFCVADINQEKNNLYKQRLCSIAQSHNRGVDFSMNWIEPTSTKIKENSLFVNLLDSSITDNCEMLFLPDGWYYNGCTNDTKFSKRMEFLRDIANELLVESEHVEFYIGCSGTETYEYFDIIIKKDLLVDCLKKTIGTKGVEDSLHIIVRP